MSLLKKRWTGPVFSFLVPSGALFFAFLWLGITPFGGKSLLTLDLRQQYAQFFAWMQETLSAGESLFFSPAKGFGGSTVGLVAYYLVSPLNLLFFCFGSAGVPEAVTLVSLLKIGLCGLCMFIFLSRRERISFRSALVFAWCYALSAYPIVFLSNLMWLDAVYLLPLIALGIERLLREGKPFGYLFSLAAGIACNAYIGIALCLFSVCYFACVLLRDRPAKPLRGTLRFAGCSLLAGGLCAALLLPTWLALGDSKVAMDISSLNLDPTFHWPAFFSRLLTSEMAYEDYVFGPPNLFCGLLALLCALVLLFRRDTPWRRRLAPLGLLVVLALSMWISGANKVWHGLNAPTWFTYRYSFLFSFVLLSMAAEGWTRQREAPHALPPLLALGVAGILLLLARFGKSGLLSSGQALLIGAFLLGMTLGLLPLPGGLKRVASWALALLCLADMGWNLYLPLRVGRFESRAEYTEAYEAWSDIKAESEARAEGFFRVERLGNLRTNDAMLVNVPSLSHYSSTSEIFSLRFLAQMGIGGTGPSIRYEQGTSLLADSFLGLRFIASASEARNLEYFQPVAQLESGETLYENPYALPLAFRVSGSLLDLREDTRDKLDWQNRLWAAALGTEDLSMLRRQESRMETRGYESLPEGELTRYQRDGDEGWIRYTVDVRQPGPLYAYLVSTWEGENDTAVWVNGELLMEDYFSTRGYGVLSLGTYQAGDQVTLELRPTGPVLMLGEACFYTMDWEVFTGAVEDLRAGASSLREVHNDRMELSGEMSGEGQMLLLTLPAVSGWTATAGGEEVAIHRAADALMAIPLPPGSYEVELRFTPPGLRVGIGISLAAALCCLLYGTLCFRRRRARLHETPPDGKT